MTKYLEYLIEYDNKNLVVYVSGLDEDGYWWQLSCHEDVNNPEDFAQGMEQMYISAGDKVTVEAVTI